MRYAALLRGINVGGTNKVEMKVLRTIFEAAGMTSVKTYINSGNVVFSTEAGDRTRLTTVLEEAIARHFGFPVSLLLLDGDQVRSIAEAIPESWTNDDSMKCDVLYLWEDADRPAVLDQLALASGIADVVDIPGAIIHRIDRENATRSRLPNLVGTPLYKRMTIRNCNTARKLLELVED